MTLRYITVSIVAFAMAATLAACDDPEAARASRAAAVKFQTWQPTDTELADKYQHSCKACHTDPGNADAPQTGDVMAWAEYLKMDRSELMQRVINGYEGMPPLGQCTECSAEDLNALIDFMAAPEHYGRAAQ